MKTSSSTVATGSPSRKLITLTFSKETGKRPSNITKVAEQWNDSLKEDYGLAGGFIGTGEYYIRVRPTAPDLSGVTAGSLEETAARDEYLTDVKTWKKKSLNELESRVNIFSAMWSCISEEAKAEIRKDGSCARIETESNDPLELWKLLVKHCSVVCRSDDLAGAELAAAKSFNSFRQDSGTMSLASFHEEFKARREVMRAQGCVMQKEATDAALFTDHLDSARYWGLKDAITSGTLPRAKTVAEAYEQASNWVVRRSQSQPQYRESTAMVAGYESEECLVADEKAKKPSGGRAKKVSGDEDSLDDEPCWGCLKPGHKVRDCKDPEHLKRVAAREASRKKYKLRVKKKAEESAHVAAEDEEVEYDEEIGAAMLHFEEDAYAGSKGREAKLRSMHSLEIGFDSMCSHHIFGEKRLLENLEECEPTTYKGIGGKITVDTKGWHHTFGEAYYHEGVPNLVSVGQLVSKKEKKRGVKVTFKNGAFRVSKGDVSYRFANTSGRNLFTTDVSSEILGEELAYDFETVEGNEKLYTKKQIEAAKRVRVYASAMGAMSMENLVSQARSRRVEGMDFTADDVVRSFKIYGPSIQAVRGKSRKKKTKRAAQKVAGKIVDSRVTLHIDLMFLSGVAFLVGYATPLCMLFCNWIKGKGASAVKRAIEKQKASLASEGFEVSEVTSDSEGAVVSLQHELEAAGTRVSIHSPNSESAEVDVKIKQLKNVTRAITVLPYLLPIGLLMYAVMYACSKINMLPNSSLAHDYSPMEMYLGRSVSVERDLGGRKGSGPIPFGSRCEFFDGTTNTLADRTRPGLWLGSKSNAYGSGWFFALDTEQVVSREQWTYLPMDSGTINLVNRIASKAPALPKNLKMIYKGAEVIDDEDEKGDVSTSDEVGEKIVTDSGGDMPYGGDEERDEPNFDAGDVVGNHEEFDSAVDPSAQIEQENDGSADLAESSTGDVDAVASSSYQETSRGTSEEQHERPSYHQPEAKQSASRQIPEPPWFLSGAPVQQSDDQRRPVRDRRPVQRYDPSAHLTEVIERQTNDMMEALDNHNGASQIRPLLEASRSMPTLGGHSAFILTVEKALKTAGLADRARASIKKELGMMDEKEVFDGVYWNDLSTEQKRRVIRSSMFLKEKLLPEPKLKARLVGGGNMQDRSLYADSEISSPTVSNSSVYMVATIAAHEGRKVRTMDVGSAYLNAKIVREVHMVIQPTLASILCEISSKYRKFLREDGSLVVRLLKALYGCVESSQLWYTEITNTLKQLGFKANEVDPCVLNVERGGHQITVCVYVDDLMVTSVDESDLCWLRDELVKKYKEVTYSDGEVHNYLGQRYDFSVVGECKVSMEDYIVEALEEYGTKGYRSTPAADGLFDIDPDAELLDEDAKGLFHSRVAKILYAALRCRPDVLLSESFLTSRVSKPTVEDWKKLERVLMYLNGTRQLGIVLRASTGLQVIAHIDASFAVHANMKSHTGCFITMGVGPVVASSKKQSLVTKSSTEAELVGLADSLPQVIWTRSFLMAQGYEARPAVVYQDNTSTIALVRKGRSTSARTRHISIRYYFVKDREDSGEVIVTHLGTSEIIADGLTKPLQGDAFRISRDRLLGGMLPVTK